MKNTSQENLCEAPKSQKLDSFMLEPFLGQNFETELSLLFSSSNPQILKSEKAFRRIFLSLPEIDRFQHIYFVKERKMVSGQWPLICQMHKSDIFYPGS